MDSFSKRNGFHSIEEVEITVREDAPEHLREFFLQLCFESKITPKTLRRIVCKELKLSPDQNNWSDNNVECEVDSLLKNCKWYKVYDLIEIVLNHIRDNWDCEIFDSFEGELNDFFIEKGIGWKVVGGLIEYRGPESFETVIRNAKATAQENGHKTASNEIHQAINDLSRKPNPDPTGAIQHAMAALECVARQLTGDQKATLGDIVKRNQLAIPTPLDQAVTKAWGYASENGRHLQEGREPSINEAELIVGLSASISHYLIKAAKKMNLEIS